MKWYKAILWLLDASLIKIKKDSEETDINVRLKRIEDKLDKANSRTIPLGLFFSGFPIMMIGFYSCLNNIMDKIPLESQSYIYYGIGAFIVCIAISWLSNKVKYGLLTLLITGGILLIFQLFNPTP